MTIELRHLRCFLTIAQERSITRAAARLTLSQPALSRNLYQLETHLGVRLVDRSTHHLRLTEAGRMFQARAAAAVAAVDETLDPSRLGTWPLRIGHAWSAVGDFTVTLLRRWQDLHPAISLELTRVDERTAGLTRGRVDAAVLRGPVNSPDLHLDTLLHEPRLAAVPTGTSLAGRSELTLVDLADHPIALNTVSGTTTLRLWPADARPGSTIQVSNTDDWLAAIAAGRAIGVTTTATAQLHPHPGVCYRALADAPPVPVYLAWKNPPTHPAVHELAALTHEVIHAIGGQARGRLPSALQA